MTKYCYLHPKREAFKECARCGKFICNDCAKEYWYTNTISAMFAPEKDRKEKLFLCPKCLKKERIKNTFISSFLILLVLGIIVGSILTASMS
ncbi:MAG: hypothetical protein ACTSYD_00600 [Candidatus Heimdallarchaeaceae archaeon]